MHRGPWVGPSSRMLDFIDYAIDSIKPKKYVDIVTFAEDILGFNPTNGKALYPRQKTLLRLMFLETDYMTAYDVAVINEWRDRFKKGDKIVHGVSPDIWERIDYLKSRGHPHFREILNISGRRAGKGVFGSIIGSRANYKWLNTPNPQDIIGIEPGKELYFYVAATTESQAVKFQFADLSRNMLGSDWFRSRISSSKDSYMHFQTGDDLRRVAEYKASGVKVDKEIASIRNLAISSNSAGSRGGACFGVIFDEMAHMIVGTSGPRTAETLYAAIEPSLDQMGKEALVYIPTSPLTKVGYVFDLYKNALAVQAGQPEFPAMFMVQLPSWGFYEDYDDPEVSNYFLMERRPPQLYDEQAKSLEKRDPLTFRVERQSQWAEVVDPAFTSAQVDKIFVPWEMDGKVQNVGAEKGVLSNRYYVHIDPAESNDNFALMIAHPHMVQEDVEILGDELGDVDDGFERQEPRVVNMRVAHLVVDMVKIWRPEDFEDNSIDYLQVEAEIIDILKAFKGVQNLSYDQYGGFATIPTMKRELQRHGIRMAVEKITFTQKSKKEMYRDLRAAMGMGWVHAFNDELFDGSSLLEAELRFLQDKNGKYHAPTFGPIQTDDLADSLAALTKKILSEQLSGVRDTIKGTRVASGTTEVFGNKKEQMAATSARESLRRKKTRAVGRGYSKVGNR